MSNKVANWEPCSRRGSRVKKRFVCDAEWEGHKEISIEGKITIKCCIWGRVGWGHRESCLRGGKRTLIKKDQLRIGEPSRIISEKEWEGQWESCSWGGGEAVRGFKWGWESHQELYLRERTIESRVWEGLREASEGSIEKEKALFPKLLNSAPIIQRHNQI